MSLCANNLQVILVSMSCYIGSYEFLSCAVPFRMSYSAGDLLWMSRDKHLTKSLSMSRHPQLDEVSSERLVAMITDLRKEVCVCADTVLLAMAGHPP